MTQNKPGPALGWVTGFLLLDTLRGGSALPVKLLQMMVFPF